MTSFVTDEEVTDIHQDIIKKENRFFGVTYPHVDKIDGVCVDVRMHYKEKTKRLFFDISMDHCMSNEDDGHAIFQSTNVKKDNGKLTEDDIRLLLTDIEKTADELKFNKRLGRFLGYKRQNYNKNHIQGDDCHVCFEPTKSKTSCNHSLCVECCQHLGDNPKCPTCREPDIWIVI